MKIKEFCEAYKAKNFMNTKQGIEERIEWIKKTIEIKSYIPFREKRKIAEMIVEQNINEVDGIKYYRSIDAYIGFIMASIVAHTNLECGGDPIANYDLLAENGLLSQIVTMFQESHNEIDILRKMALAEELEDNNTNVLIGHFLDAVLNKVEGLSGMIDDVVGGLDVKKILNDENVAKIIGLLNK